MEKDSQRLLQATKVELGLQFASWKVFKSKKEILEEVLRLRGAQIYYTIPEGLGGGLKVYIIYLKPFTRWHFKTALSVKSVNMGKK